MLKINRTNVAWPITLAISFCLILWIGGMHLTHWYASKTFIVPEGDSRALFGDSFGAVNALISAFAFAGVIVSMYLQRKDLQLQRESLEVQQKELKQNTKELALQRAEFQTQNKTMQFQRFENTFFNMMSLQQEIVNNIAFHYSKKERNLQPVYLTVHGRQVFEYIYNHGLKTLIKEGKAFSEFAELSIFDHYFRHLYRIIKFIDETSLLETKHERYTYTSMVRATLSRYELVFIFYNELNNDFSNFKILMEEYSLLNNLNSDILIEFEPNGSKAEQLEQYNESAYNPKIKGYNKPITERSIVTA